VVFFSILSFRTLRFFELSLEFLDNIFFCVGARSECV